MNMLLNAITLALREIRRNVVRSSLTTLGIVIGVAAVIVMVTVGNGATEAVKSNIASLGSNLLTVMPGQRVGPGGSSGTAKEFKLQDANALERDVPALALVAPMATQVVSVIAGNRNWSTTVTGTTNPYFESGNWRLADGQWFSDGDARAGRSVCIIGATVRLQLFGNQNPIGERIRLRGVSCEVVGLLQPKGKSSFGQDRDDTIVMPLRAFQRRIAGNDAVRQIQVSVRSDIETSKAQRDITRVMRERRRVGPTDQDDFTIMDMQEVASTLAGTTRVLTGLLAAVAAVSLVVGGIGIMNIMIVSVTERTREIGIRMAIGALESEVLTQFLVESVVLSAFGGLIGIALAIALSAVISQLLGLPFSVDWRIVALGFVFSGLVGVLFGYMPARRAAALNPIDALRHE
jgi:putative ABC transport system permease protein